MQPGFFRVNGEGQFVRLLCALTLVLPTALKPSFRACATEVQDEAPEPRLRRMGFFTTVFVSTRTSREAERRAVAVRPGPGHPAGEMHPSLTRAPPHFGSPMPVDLQRSAIYHERCVSQCAPGIRKFQSNAGLITSLRECTAVPVAQMDRALVS